MKIVITIITLILYLFIPNLFSQNSTNTKTNKIDCSIGYTRYFVDPDAHLKLSGATGEIKILFKRKYLDFFSKGFYYNKEITFAYSTVLNGNINASAFSVSYGKRYEFSRMYLGFGFGPFSYYLFSNNKKDQHSGYSLDTGLRLNVYYMTGIKITVQKKYAFACNIKYNFTVKKVYLHNPFSAHKHKDLFQYLTFGLGYNF